MSNLGATIIHRIISTELNQILEGDQEVKDLQAYKALQWFHCKWCLEEQSLLFVQNNTEHFCSISVISFTFANISQEQLLILYQQHLCVY